MLGRQRGLRSPQRLLFFFPPLPSPTQAPACPGLGPGDDSRARCAAGAGGARAGGGAAPSAGVSASRVPRTRAFPAAVPGVGRAAASLRGAQPRGRLCSGGRGTPLQAAGCPVRPPPPTATPPPSLPPSLAPGREVPNPAGFPGAGCGRYLPSAAAGRGAGG